MSSPKHPKLNSLPKLKDPNNVQEVYCNQLISIGIRDNIAHITLSVIRPSHEPVTGIANDENVVVGRIAMPMHTFDALVGASQQLRAAVKMNEMPVGKPS